ncbi:Fe-S cluster assembly protein SufD [Gordonia pseudamarae]|jgi:Fe-S cluster assembly protein SufD|uniref:Fe-S cluster assembly protein SufD n=1 Tax=Gordonia pseudamarae TaxID=2831662 RepID=A0ABX6IJW9_9ACTN|nr:MULTISPECIES: Fe-S cluster assembly protein SufD [Gordonia]MBD0021301.1 Fe-S cluster assembly protein SufD [Gordonia sp. (in: high G+C Gram-positive bacteria)]QHN26517.1 Fe-S cluster assembly protein SufD [Gordonia pseudamarae]QHN35411.1 Fe-S cluster assembly protein SufD [Gordonia pseudamarae]
MADPTLPVGAQANPAPANAAQVNKGQQFTSFDVNAFEIPNQREEAWRFTPFRRLRGLHDGTAVRTADPAITVEGVTEAVTVDTVGRDDPRLAEGGAPFDRVAAQAFSSFTAATVITVAKETELAEPVIVRVTGPGVDEVGFGHIQVRLDAFARAVVVLDQQGSGTYAENIQFIVGDHAHLTVVNVHDWADDAVHVAAHHIGVGRDAIVRHFAVSLGGNLVRLSPVVHYHAPGGDAELWGLYFADAGQHLEQRLLVDHSQPNCRSNVVYKGALQSDGSGDRMREAHTVWIGDVLIRPEAEGTDTFELNRNLVLTDGARADSVPNLEIETGEIVGAGHASATGRFDDEQLFYLQSRGISEAEARRLVILGFFGEIILKIGVKEVRQRLADAIEEELKLVVL